MHKFIPAPVLFLVLLPALPPAGALRHGMAFAQHGASVHSAQGYLGIDVRDAGDEQATKPKDLRGAVIVRVDHDGPAGKMGLREHDIVLAMNGTLIDGEEQIRRMLRDTAPGRTVALLISRDGQQISLTAQMADRADIERQAWELHLAVPAGPQAPSSNLATGDQMGVAQTSTPAPVPVTKYSKGFLGTILLSPAYTGVMLERIGPQLSQFFGVPKGAGLLVKNVDANSPASTAGVRAGDVLLRANARGISSMTDWSRVVRDSKGRAIAVTILRDRQEHMLMITPDARKHS